MSEPIAGCPFCVPKSVVLAGKLVYACRDAHPVAPGHLLIIPKRHVPTYFDTTASEKAEIVELLDQARDWLAQEFCPDGLNVGVNCGAVAGQSIMHAHIHLIPRYQGDMDDPRGGVRGVIPHKQKY